MSSPIIPVESSNTTLAAQVHQRIREAILARTLKPGTRIDQYQIASALNVSLAPVREALKTLEAEGFVTIYPRRGVFVATISIANLDELYFARTLIEGETIALAAPLLTAEGLNTLQKRVDRMKEVSAKDDIETYITLNREFHLGIYSVLNNQTLLQIIQNLWRRSELYRYRYMLITHDRARVHREHQIILDACMARDQAAAREAAITHIRNTQNDLHALFHEEDERLAAD